MAHEHLLMGPVLGGIVAGVLHAILSPDHLCTIVTLSACQGAKAFWFGFRWAGGHLAGMCVLGTICAILKLSSSGMAWESYENIMDYAIGVMLISFGVYFVFNSEKYFDQEWSPKQASCACHAHILPPDGHQHAKSGSAHGDEESVRERLLPRKQAASSPWELRNTGSMLVGFVQGVACPAGLVGTSLLKGYSLPHMFIFIAVFFVFTTLSMGSLAMAYGMVTQRCISSPGLARGIYFASSFLSIAMGCLWISLNALGILDEFLGHDHDHGHGHGHGLHDHHHHESMTADASMLMLLTLQR